MVTLYEAKSSGNLPSRDENERKYPAHGEPIRPAVPLSILIKRRNSEKTAQSRPGVPGPLGRELGSS